MKFSPLVLLPALVISLALLPASRGELSLLRHEVAETRQTLATLLPAPEKQAPERTTQVAQVMDRTAKRSAKSLKGQGVA